MDSGGISDFLRQIPPGFILIFCGSGVLLVIALAVIFRDRFIAKKAVPPVVAAPGAYPSYADSAGMGDLPDLDMLADAQALKPARPAGTFSVSLAQGEMVEAVEVLTVLRDVGDGTLIIRIGDKAYRNPPAVADTEFKRRFQTTLRDLTAAPSISAGKPQPKVSTSEVAAENVELPIDVPSDDVIETPAPTATSSAEIPRFSPSMPAPGDLPKFKMPDGPPVKPKRGQRPVAEPVPEINIAGSIEAFLQHKLALTSQYAGRSIHVRPAMHGALAIEVDGKFYDSVGEVADASVRQFLSATIEEWQSRQ
ncbi:MAG TPA: hypothetical protein VHD90_21005 [Phototrophicaceae bacterium]|nr:hypothetical protein [Phototrophicaceae bacterium]